MNTSYTNESKRQESQSGCPFSWLKGLLTPPKNHTHAPKEITPGSKGPEQKSDNDILASIKEGTLSLANTTDWRQRYREYELLRDTAPVYFDNSTKTWIITRYDDIRELGRNSNLDLSKIIPAKVQSLTPAQRASISEISNSLKNWMIYQPNEEHLNIKRTFIRAFNKSATEMMTPAVRDAALSLLQDAPAPGSGQEFDFMEKYARPLPTLVLARMMGVPAQDLQMVSGWTSDLTAFMADFVVANNLNPEIANKASAAICQMREYFGKRVKAVRAKSDGTILAHVVGTTDLADDAITDQCIHIIFGGNKVPEYMAGNALYHVLKSRNGYEMIRSSNLYLAQALEEAARVESPVQFITRSVLSDFTFRGQQLKQGDLVYLVLGSANRDRSFCTNPDLFEPQRSQVAHLAFGVGSHACVASGMVRSQLFEMFKVFTERYAQVTFDTPNENPQWTHNATFHGLSELKIRV